MILNKISVSNLNLIYLYKSPFWRGNSELVKFQTNSNIVLLT